MAELITSLAKAEREGSLRERCALDPLSGRLPVRAEVDEEAEISVLVGRVS